jgi:hypothetical protein
MNKTATTLAIVDSFGGVGREQAHSLSPWLVRFDDNFTPPASVASPQRHNESDMATNGTKG